MRQIVQKKNNRPSEETLPVIPKILVKEKESETDEVVYILDK
jgi:hypothetical protein